MNDIVVRPSVGADSDAIAHIAQTTGLFSADMLPDMIAGYLTGSKADVWLTAEGTAGPIGFAFCEPERMTSGTWNLLAIGVLPKSQGQGVGADIVRRLEMLLRENGQRILLVETLGTPEFEQTRSFYVKNGFIEEARIREFYEVGGDKIVFWKHL